MAEVIRREQLLLDPEVRCSPQRVRALLHPDYVELGASGQRWDAASITAALEREGSEVDSSNGTVEAREMVAAQLAGDVVLLTYEAHRPGRVSLRSSVWVRLDGQWRVRFHQGTVANS